MVDHELQQNIPKSKMCWVLKWNRAQLEAAKKRLELTPAAEAARTHMATINKTTEASDKSTAAN